MELYNDFFVSQDIYLGGGATHSRVILHDGTLCVSDDRTCLLPLRAVPQGPKIRNFIPLKQPFDREYLENGFKSQRYMSIRA